MRNGQTEAERRKKRRHRRVLIIVIYTAIAVGLAWFFESQATTTIIFVRHAEKAAEPAEDPGLSDTGRRRVAELTRQLVDADVVAGIDAVYSTPFRRSLETAKPLADALGLEIQRYDPSDNEAVLAEILKRYKGKIILVVAHSNTVPTLIADLGASKKVPPIAENEYDNIYIISIPWFGKTKTIRLRYGDPYLPGPPANGADAVSAGAQAAREPV
ncbi:MAG: histidine phosphatase family protein [Gammaproteobacteria bacterium]|nr:histidine phosphatase family protein [Gammaproteobacteria bacterium]MDH4254011.1 histidine phosphatase family protein [Gammaproteobacteria bacterium]MDH5311129.1 histidine phosphatase family protein [Gammaproteobacteria bacterium]